MKRYKQFKEDTSFAAAVPANAVGSGQAIANIDPLLKRKKIISRLQKTVSSSRARRKTNP